jgi:hypothetical protein
LGVAPTSTDKSRFDIHDFYLLYFTHSGDGRGGLRWDERERVVYLYDDFRGPGTVL